VKVKLNGMISEASSGNREALRRCSYSERGVYLITHGRATRRSREAPPWGWRSRNSSRVTARWHLIWN